MMLSEEKLGFKVFCHNYFCHNYDVWLYGWRSCIIFLL